MDEHPNQGWHPHSKLLHATYQHKLGRLVYDEDGRHELLASSKHN